MEDLLPPYGQAVARVTDEVNKLIPEGQNLRKIFGHLASRCDWSERLTGPLAPTGWFYATASALWKRPVAGHDHVIRYHTLKGVPVPRTSCIFLRERPQCSSDVLRKTPSIFRDLIRACAAYNWVHKNVKVLRAKASCVHLFLDGSWGPGR